LFSFGQFFPGFRFTHDQPSFQVPPPSGVPDDCGFLVLSLRRFRQVNSCAVLSPFFSPQLSNDNIVWLPWSRTKSTPFIPHQNPLQGLPLSFCDVRHVAGGLFPWSFLLHLSVILPVSPCSRSFFCRHCPSPKLESSLGPFSVRNLTCHTFHDKFFTRSVLSK